MEANLIVLRRLQHTTIINNVSWSLKILIISYYLREHQFKIGMGVCMCVCVCVCVCVFVSVDKLGCDCFSIGGDFFQTSIIKFVLTTKYRWLYTCM